MKVYLQKRATGKTTKLIDEAAEKHLYIVCRSQERASEIQQQAMRRALNIPFPLTFDEFVSSQFHGAGIKGFLIDDADALLNRLSRGVGIVAITMTDSI